MDLILQSSLSFDSSDDEWSPEKNTNATTDMANDNLERCFCGQPADEDSIYCSTQCAREDAFRALCGPSTESTSRPQATPLQRLPSTSSLGSTSSSAASHYRRRQEEENRRESQQKQQRPSRQARHQAALPAKSTSTQFTPAPIAPLSLKKSQGASPPRGHAPNNSDASMDSVASSRGASSLWSNHQNHQNYWSHHTSSSSHSTAASSIVFSPEPSPGFSEDRCSVTSGSSSACSSFARTPEREYAHDSYFQQKPGAGFYKQRQHTTLHIATPPRSRTPPACEPTTRSPAYLDVYDADDDVDLDKTPEPKAARARSSLAYMREDESPTGTLSREFTFGRPLASSLRFAKATSSGSLASQYDEGFEMEEERDDSGDLGSFASSHQGHSRRYAAQRHTRGKLSFEDVLSVLSVKD